LRRQSTADYRPTSALISLADDGRCWSGGIGGGTEDAHLQCADQPFRSARRHGPKLAGTSTALEEVADERLGVSQRELAGLVRKVEDRHAGEHLFALEVAFEYLQNWTAELERRKCLGIDKHDLVPHPDDIIIDMHTGQVRIEGLTDEFERRI